MKRAAAYAALACLFACSAEPRHEPEEPGEDARQAYEETAERLATRFLDAGQVVSRLHGEPYHLGDSLIWTGIAAGAMPCRLVAPIEDALIANIESNAGHVVRFRPLPDEYRGGREASLDGVLGLWSGIAKLAKRCGIGPHWANAFEMHVTTVLESGEVYPGAANASVVPWFATVLRQLSCRAGSGACPSSGDRLALAAAVSSWAYVVKQTQSAAYRIHLGYLALSTLEDAGADVGRERGMFCTATLGVGMPLIDHWCGRDGLAEWLAGFQWNAQEYALQRGPWESADGREGLETPGLDRLVALDTLFNFGGELK